MSKTSQGPGSRIQKGASQLAQKLISPQGESLSKASAPKIRLLVGLLIIVCGVVSAAYWPVLSAQAVMFDDDQFLTEYNPLVQNPGWASVRRIFTEVLEPSVAVGYYQPLSMISLMADYAMGGRENNLQPFHRTSLALHVLNTVLVIVLLYSLFGQPVPAALVGLLFGVHPLTVEPVAWISDRKTLLAMFFVLWCLIFYVRYVKRGSWKLYGVSVIMYVLALMSKPTALPLPALLLVTDFWPLRRLSRKTILEKLSFFVVGGIFAVIILISNTRSVVPNAGSSGINSLVGQELLRIPLVICYLLVFYLGKIIWPTKLSSVYQLPEPLSVSNPPVLIGVIVTCALIVVLLLSLRRTRALLTGCLFFFVAIFPVLGVVRFSSWITASDKYVYMPAVGLLMILAWALGQRWKLHERRITISKIGLLVLVLLLSAAQIRGVRRYLVHWRDTVGLGEYMLALAPDSPPVHNMLGEALNSQGKVNEAVNHYRQALEGGADNAEVHSNLGNALVAQGKLDEAISHHRRALQLRPSSAEMHNNLGGALVAQGKLDDAISHFRQALQIRPDHPEVHYNLGLMLQSQGNIDEAISHYRQALQARPDYAEAHNDLGNVLVMQGRLDQAISHYRQALRLEPEFTKAHNNLGSVLIVTGKFGEAIEHFREAVRLKPDHIAFLDSTAWILATHPDSKLRDAAEAIELAEHAAELTRCQDAMVLETLAAAYAAAGWFDKAVATAQAAIKLASAAGDNKLANNIRKRLELYKQGKSYKEPVQLQGTIRP